MYDVVIVGGSAAGLSAALVLGRSRRSVLVCDTHQPRNGVSSTSHSVYTRDGTPTAELVAIGRAQLLPYAVAFRSVGATLVQAADQRAFLTTLADGKQVRSRRVLLATGVRDILPALAGIEPFWGTSVVHCPYCHGWEVRDQPIALLSAHASAVNFSQLLQQWSRDLVLCTNGFGKLTAAERDQMLSLDIQIYEQPIRRLEGRQAQLDSIQFVDGTRIERKTLFIHTDHEPQSRLAHDLGCKTGEGGIVIVDEHGQTSVAGIYAAGDIMRQNQQIIFAAADGARAAMAINQSLVDEDFRQAF
jgi:thioredoxin reductase